MRLFAVCVMLALAAACGGSPSRSTSAGGAEGAGQAGGVGQAGQAAATESNGVPAKGNRKPFRGRIITLTDSLLVHGGSDTLRFGRLGSGEIAVQRFRIENASTKPLVLVSTQRSCGCISLDHDNQPLAPGRQLTLDMTFDSRGEYGWQLKRMDLIFAGARKPLRIYVEADVE